MEKEIEYFIDSLELERKKFYLLLYKPIGPYYNKVDEYKKLWKNYPGTKYMKKGEEISYIFREGIIFASIAHMGETNLESAIDILIQNELHSAIIYSDVDLTQYCNLYEIFNEMFNQQMITINNPENLCIDFQYLMKKICKKKSGFLRYANDGDEAEIAFFINSER